jgi:hypothetical protein
MSFEDVLQELLHELDMSDKDPVHDSDANPPYENESSSGDISGSSHSESAEYNPNSFDLILDLVRKKRKYPVASTSASGSSKKKKLKS